MFNRKNILLAFIAAYFILEIIETAPNKKRKLNPKDALESFTAKAKTGAILGEYFIDSVPNDTQKIQQAIDICKQFGDTTDGLYFYSFYCILC